MPIYGTRPEADQDGADRQAPGGADGFQRDRAASTAPRPRPTVPPTTPDHDLALSSRARPSTARHRGGPTRSSRRTPRAAAVVQGDTTTSTAVRSPLHRGIPAIHAEAGLRLFRPPPLPEEANRQDDLPDHLPAPGPHQHLQGEPACGRRRRGRTSRSWAAP
ncbi:hypothetical protein QJS66_03345 [Kocuria rhizophila]|nr:hypothetical protein QJS66_03345 [Kocuria rhizophila]